MKHKEINKHIPSVLMKISKEQKSKWFSKQKVFSKKDIEVNPVPCTELSKKTFGASVYFLCRVVFENKANENEKKKKI